MKRRWRVRVQETNYGQVGVVFITRRRFDRFHQHGIKVATVQLNADDAEDQLADARAKAASLARQITELDGSVA